MNDLYIIEKDNKEPEDFRYLHILSEARNQKEHDFRWTDKLSEAKIFRTHKEANKYESIYNAAYLNVYKVKKRRLIILREKVTRIPKFETIEIF